MQNNTTQGVEHSPDPTEAFNIVKDTAQEITLARNRESYMHFGVWGAGWLIGYSSLAIGTSQRQNGDTTTSAWSFIVFAIVLIAAFAASWIIGARSSLGIHSQRPEHRYFKQLDTTSNWSYALAFLVGMGGLSIFAGKYGLGNTEISVLYNFVAPLILGILYWFQGAIYGSRTQSLAGVWMMALSWSTIIAGIPVGYWIMAMVGGGGLLIAFLVTWISAHHQASTAAAELE
jgi:hypothetical protein